VYYNRHAVAGQSDIKLNSVGATAQGAIERRDCVLGGYRCRPAVTDD